MSRPEPNFYFGICAFNGEPKNKIYKLKDIVPVVYYHAIRTILLHCGLMAVRSFPCSEIPQNNLHFRSRSHRSPALRPVFRVYKIDSPKLIVIKCGTLSGIATVEVASCNLDEVSSCCQHDSVKAEDGTNTWSGV
jgi:hypothetical protein